MLVKYEEKIPPAILCTGRQVKTRQGSEAEGLIADSSADKTAPSNHQERENYLGEISEEFQAMIHTAVPDSKVYGIPGAKAALDKEWKKLFDMDAFAIDEVMEYQAVVEKYKKIGKKFILAQ